MRLLLILGLLARSFAVELTESNWDKLSEGKSVFVKFYTTWCKHCTEIAPLWKHLEDKFSDSDTVLVGSVRCNGDGHGLCEREMVNTFPIIKYGAHDTLYEYRGELTVSGWEEKINTLVKPCDPLTLAHCSKEEIGHIRIFYNMTPEGLKDYVESFKTKVDEIIKIRDEKLTEATALYEEAVNEYDKGFAMLQQEYPLELMNAVGKARKKFKEVVALKLKKQDMHMGS